MSFFDFDPFTFKGSSQNYGFSRSHVWVWELDHKENWVPKNWFFWTVVLEKTLESPLDCKEIKPVHPKGNQSWIFVGRTDAEAETSILWQTDSFENTLMLGKTEGRRRRGWQGTRCLDGITDSMNQFEQTPGDSEGQGNLMCCSPWGSKDSDMTEQLNWTRDYGFQEWMLLAGYGYF